MARKRTRKKSSRGLIRRRGNGTGRPRVRSRGFYRMIYSVSFRGT